MDLHDRVARRFAQSRIARVYTVEERVDLHTRGTRGFTVEERVDLPSRDTRGYT